MNKAFISFPTLQKISKQDSRQTSSQGDTRQKSNRLRVQLQTTRECGQDTQTEPLWSVTTCTSQVKASILIRTVNLSNARQSCELQQISEKKWLLFKSLRLLQANSKTEFHTFHKVDHEPKEETIE